MAAPAAVDGGFEMRLERKQSQYKSLVTIPLLTYLRIYDFSYFEGRNPSGEFIRVNLFVVVDRMRDLKYVRRCIKVNSIVRYTLLVYI